MGLAHVPTACMNHQFTVTIEAWGGDPQQPERRPLARTKFDAFITSVYYWQFFLTIPYTLDKKTTPQDEYINMLKWLVVVCWSLCQAEVGNIYLKLHQFNHILLEPYRQIERYANVYFAPFVTSFYAIYIGTLQTLQIYQLLYVQKYHYQRNRHVIVP